MLLAGQGFGVFGWLWLEWSGELHWQDTACGRRAVYLTSPIRPADIDNDLVKIGGKAFEAGGEVVTLKGQVLDEAGQPRTGVRVEIWRCDSGGRYLHSGDRQAILDRTADLGLP